MTEVVDDVTVYMGDDKHENELLIQWGWPEDVWFHADSLSSAHVYLRMTQDMTMDTIPDELIEECCQLTKANSIEGCKKKSIRVVYTMWENLRKHPSMEIGQVGYHDGKKVKTRKVVKNKPMVKAISKTRQQVYPDLQAERRMRDETEAAQQKLTIQLQNEQRDEEIKLAKQSREEAKRSLFDDLSSDEDEGASSLPADYEDNFM